MLGVIVFIQAIACILLMIVILMQSGRGGGLTEAFASAERMFGSKTNEVLVRGTVILALVFMLSNLYLVYLSSKRERSLFDQGGKPAADSAATTLPLTTLPLADTVNAVK